MLSTQDYPGCYFYAQTRAWLKTAAWPVTLMTMDAIKITG
nr:MAG TPA: hypothetical protein [Caudoviricetes sp.]